MTDNSARFRPVAFILGVSFIALPFFPVDDDVDLFTLGFGVTLGAIFIAYGIGGPSLLKKIGLASFVTKGARKESDSKHKIKSGLSFLTVGVGLGIFSLFFEQEGGLYFLPFILSTAGLITLAQGLFTRLQEGGSEADTDTPAPTPPEDPQ